MKKALVIVGVVAVLVLAAALYFLFNGTTKAPEMAVTGDAATTTETAATEEQPIQGKGSLESLLALSRPLECTISYAGTTSTTPTEGTYFTAGGKLRGDFVVPEMATGSVSSIIARDNTLYTWSVIEGETYGMKIDLTTLKSTQGSETAPDTHEPVPLDAQVAYSCTPWKTIDTSIFEVPTNVLFTDYADVMNMGMEFSTIYEEAPTTDTSTQCALCEKVKGEAQAACKAQFKCGN